MITSSVSSFFAAALFLRPHSGKNAAGCCGRLTMAWLKCLKQKHIIKLQFMRAHSVSILASAHWV